MTLRSIRVSLCISQILAVCILLLALILLSACATTPAGGIGGPTLDDDKGLFLAEAVVNGGAQATSAVIDAGGLSCETAAKGVPIAEKIVAAVAAAEAAYDLGAAATVQSQSFAIMALAIQAQALSAPLPKDAPTSGGKLNVTAVQLLAAALSTAPTVQGLVTGSREVLASKDPVFVGSELGRIRAANATALPAILAKLKIAAAC